jgi:hypothetical protein
MRRRKKQIRGQCSRLKKLRFLSPLISVVALQEQINQTGGKKNDR